MHFNSSMPFPGRRNGAFRPASVRFRGRPATRRDAFDGGPAHALLLIRHDPRCRASDGAILRSRQPGSGWAVSNVPELNVGIISSRFCMDTRRRCQPSMPGLRSQRRTRCSCCRARHGCSGCQLPVERGHLPGAADRRVARRINSHRARHTAGPGERATSRPPRRRTRHSTTPDKGPDPRHRAAPS